MCLPIGHDGRKGGKEFGKEIVGQEKGPHPGRPGESAEIPIGAGANGPKVVVHERFGGGGILRGGFNHVDLVIEFVVKVRGDGAGMNGADVNAQGFAFNVQGGGELTDKGFGGRVHDGKGCRNKARHGTGKDDASFFLLLDQFLDKIMTDIETSRGVAFHIGE